MARQTKPTKTTSVEESAPVSAPVSTPVSTPVSVQSATTTEVKVKKVKVAKKETPVEASPVVQVETTVSTPVVEEASAESHDVETSLTDLSTDFFSKLQQLSVAISTLKTEYRALEKKWAREMKASLKNKKKRKAGNRAPSGFVKPTKISDELAKFLDKPTGSEMARTEVTRDINQYIRANSLQDKTNGRRIIPDAKLSSLLKIKKGEELTYFNLQRYMSCHFAKTKVDAPATTVSA